jgi:hypothetical protein
MGMVGIDDPATDRPIDLRRDNEHDAEAQIDASVLSLAGVFGAVAFPPDLPDHIKDAILKRAEQAREAAGHFVIDNDRPSKNSDKGANDERDYALIELTQQLEQQRREAENEAAWLGSSHTYAGQTLSGEEWMQMRDWFGNEDNVAAWEDAMMAETGESREEVRQTGGKMKRFYDLMDKDAKGTMTGDERTEYDRLNQDREVKRGIEKQKEMQGIRVDHGQDHTAQSASTYSGDAREWAAGKNRVNNDSMGTPTALSKVEPLSQAYQRAASGEVPQKLDAVAVPTVASATVKISPDNMFG